MDSNNYQKLQEIQRNIDNLKSFMEDNLPERVVEDFRIPGIPGLWGGIDIPDIPSMDSIFNSIKNTIKKTVSFYIKKKYSVIFSIYFLNKYFNFSIINLFLTSFGIVTLYQNRYTILENSIDLYFIG